MVDSDTERRFAQDLEESADVCAFARLPRSFKIRTPVGDYRARLGHRLQRGLGEAHLLRGRDQGVAADAQSQGRREGEDRCARKLFEQLGEDDVRYDFVSTYEELMDKVMR